jgi:heptosyltransferase-3
MAIGKRQLINRWTSENWEDVGRALLQRFAHVVILTGPARDEVELANGLASQLGPRAIATLGRTSWPQVAGLLYRARLFVGLDTAAMHLAAACQCPVVALFGPSIEDHWHPWRAPYRIVTTPDFVPAADPIERQAEMKRRRMGDIRPADVIAACDAMPNRPAS